MTCEILIEAGPIETRIALVRAGHLEDLIIEDPSNPSLLGSIWVGRVTGIAHGLQTAFVDLGLERHGFLPRREARALHPEMADLPIERLVTEGQSVLVQIKKEAHADKGAVLTSFITLPGRFLVLNPYDRAIHISKRIENTIERERLLTSLQAALTCGAIVRTAAQGHGPDDILAEAKRLNQRWDNLKNSSLKRSPPTRLWYEPFGISRLLRNRSGVEVARIRVEGIEAFTAMRQYVREELGADWTERIEIHTQPTLLFDEAEITNQIAHIMQPYIKLPSGGRLTIEQTRALTAIDIDSASDTQGHDLERIALRTNMEAASEIAAQLRLRDIGGIVIIDFIQMSQAAHRQQVTDHLKKAFANDLAPVRISTLSEFGLVELVRRRQGADLTVRQTQPCSICDGMGRVRSVAQTAAEVFRAVRREAAQTPGRRLRLRLNPKLKSYLEVHVAYPTLRDGSGQVPTIETALTLKSDQFEIINA